MDDECVCCAAFDVADIRASKAEGGRRILSPLSVGGAGVCEMEYVLLHLGAAAGCCGHVDIDGGGDGGVIVVASVLVGLCLPKAF